jgi:hypothetical protein
VVLLDVTVAEDAVVTARDLRITQNLQMAGNSSLAAAAGSEIVITDGETVISMAAKGVHLPVLDLGEIGSNYRLLPGKLTVTAPSGLSSAERESFRHGLISGETLSNCEDWKEALKIVGTGFEAECGSPSGARLLAASGDVLTLFIKGVPDDDAPNYLLYGVIGAGGLTVIIVVIVVVVKLRKSDGLQYSGSSGSTRDDRHSRDRRSHHGHGHSHGRSHHHSHDHGRSHHHGHDHGRSHHGHGRRSRRDYSDYGSYSASSSGSGRRGRREHHGDQKDFHGIKEDVGIWIGANAAPYL